MHLHTNRQAMSVIVHTPDAYLHQRADGTILVGATVEEAGFDCRLTSEGVASQLRAGLAAMPALSEWSFKGAQVALRPGTDRTMPYVGKLEGIDNLMVASDISATAYYWRLLLASWLPIWRLGVRSTAGWSA